MLEHRDVVLAGIADRCGSDFEPLSTFSDWFLALQQIADIAARITGECEWSSPSLPGEREKMSEQIMLMGNFFESLEKRMPGST